MEYLWYLYQQNTIELSNMHSQDALSKALLSRYSISRSNQREILLVPQSREQTSTKNHILIKHMTSATLKPRSYLVLILSVLFLQGSVYAHEQQLYLSRYVPNLKYVDTDITKDTETARYKPIFGEGDKDEKHLNAITRMGELIIDRKFNCSDSIRRAVDSKFYSWKRVAWLSSRSCRLKRPSGAWPRN
ncbi:MAG: hypothetical protein ACI92G_002249 [Candidatus Pelagisphaera sp.]|jgi:hypothetical protein